MRELGRVFKKPPGVKRGVQTHPRRLEGRYRGGFGGNEWGKEAGPALNPLKGILGLSSPYAQRDGKRTATLKLFCFISLVSITAVKMTWRQ